MEYVIQIVSVILILVAVFWDTKIATTVDRRGRQHDFTGKYTPETETRVKSHVRGKKQQLYYSEVDRYQLRTVKG